MKAWLLLALALTGVGCHKAEALVVVSVSTKLTFDTPIDHLGVQIASPYGATSLSVGTAPVSLPTTFGMDVAKRFDAAITVTVTAFDTNYRVLASGTGMGSASAGERSNVAVVLDQLPPPADMSMPIGDFGTIDGDGGGSGVDGGTTDL